MGMFDFELKVPDVLLEIVDTIQNLFPALPR